jgi:hypothetical protein
MMGPAKNIKDKFTNNDRQTVGPIPRVWVQIWVPLPSIGFSSATVVLTSRCLPFGINNFHLHPAYG